MGTTILNGVIRATGGFETGNRLAGISQDNTFILNVDMADISTAGSTWVVSPYVGKITKIYSVIDGAIITADAAITVEIGGTAVTDAGITIAIAGSAAGVIDSSTPTALNTVAAGQAIEILSNGAATNVVKATFTLVIERT